MGLVSGRPNRPVCATSPRPNLPHYRHPNRGQAAPKQQWPATFEGGQLATEVQNNTACSNETKTKLIREIHGARRKPRHLHPDLHQEGPKANSTTRVALIVGLLDVPGRARSP